MASTAIGMLVSPDLAGLDVSDRLC
jgi:hypothetical protein